jgi:hypothetical protein
VKPASGDLVPRRPKAINFPSGDQLGQSPPTLGRRSTRPLPTSTTDIAPCSCATTIRRESGDQS